MSSAPPARVSQSRLLATTEAVEASAPAAPSATPREIKTREKPRTYATAFGKTRRRPMPSTPPTEAPARCARKIGTRGRTQGDEMESTPARKAAIKETSTPMGQPYHRRLGAAIDRIVDRNGPLVTAMIQPADSRN